MRQHDVHTIVKEWYRIQERAYMLGDLVDFHEEWACWICGISTPLETWFLFFNEGRTESMDY